MENFKEIFEAYGGNYGITMERFVGNEAVYLRIFNMLFQDENMGKLGLALSENNLEAAFEAAHALKGVAGNLGLEPLYQAVCQLVEPLRNKEQREDYSDLYKNVSAEFQKVEGLRKMLEGGE